MERTQIYLTKRETAALAQVARETGRTRSQLIREAIEARYMTPRSERTLQVLDRTAGLWADRTETGEQYVDRIRTGRLARLYDRGHHRDDREGDG
ncbi:MAG: CopG family transcriptional regulator [Candidatus Limnocylindrales bacterium]